MDPNYAQAVSFATKFLSDGVYSEKAKGIRAEPTEFLYIFGLQIEQGFDDHAWCPTFYTYPENAFKFLFMKSKIDKGAFNIASRIVTTRLLRDEVMSEEERIFAGMVLGGMQKCPAPEGKKLSQSFAQNLHLVFLAKILNTDYNLKLTRNEESKNRDSACDAVSDALQNIGVHKSWEAIKNLLVHKSSKRVRDVADAMTSFIEQSKKSPGEAALLASWVGDN